MSQTQKIIKYLAIAFAIYLVVIIFSGIVSLIGAIGGSLSNDDRLMENLEEIKVADSFDNIEIEIGNLNLTIKEGETLKVETNSKNVSYKGKSNTLTLEEKSNNWLNRNKKTGELVITIPKNSKYKKVSISNGAGKINIDTLKTNNLELNVGAGKVSINNLVVESSTDIDGGAGEIVINNSELSNLDLDMGVGKVTISGKLYSSSDIDAGVGELSINLDGSEEDYEISIEKGVGEATINGENIKNEAVYGNGSNKIDIDGGIGKISINFNN